jgi:hypothetical protein
MGVNVGIAGKIPEGTFFAACGDPLLVYGLQVGIIVLILLEIVFGYACGRSK